MAATTDEYQRPRCYFINCDALVSRWYENDVRTWGFCDFHYHQAVAEDKEREAQAERRKVARRAMRREQGTFLHGNALTGEPEWRPDDPRWAGDGKGEGAAE